MNRIKNICKSVVALLGATVDITKQVWRRVLTLYEATVGRTKQTCKRVVTVVVATVVGAVSAFAQSSGPMFADPSTITTTATTVFTAVAALMVGIVGFWVVLKIVRKISGR
jgi:hypothetical protein